MRVLLDVGAHYGETLDVALDPRWGFDRIICFEPSAPCANLLRRFRDPRVRVVEAGLSCHSGIVTLYGAGLLGGSVYEDKIQLEAGAGTHRTESVLVVRASEWIAAHTAETDDVHLKLNCEGSEVDILEDLLDAGLEGRLSSVYVDFDVRKVPSQAHRRAGAEASLAAAGVRYTTPELLGGSGDEGVARWLSATCHRSPGRRGLKAVAAYRLGLHRPLYVRARRAGAALLPATALEAVARRFGMQRRARAAA